MMTGTCSCGNITYEVTSNFSDGITHCHCPSCQKRHGSAFSSTTALSPDELHFISGTSLLKPFESSPGKINYFCSNCGSPIYSKQAGRDHWLLHMGTLNSDPNIAMARHRSTDLKAPWYHPHHELCTYHDWPKSTATMSHTSPSEYQNLYSTMQEILKNGKKNEASTSLLLLEINVAENQPIATEITKQFNQRIKSNIRDSDLIAPLQPCHFAVLLPYTDSRASIIMAERIRNTTTSWIKMKNAVCIGATTMNYADLDVDKLIESSHQAVIEAEKACLFSRKEGGDRATHFNTIKH
ncbi:MAG: GFA family protein [Mariprofundus sp.]|nr:GFA family protein [Mariprofundus sp.]